MWFEAILYSPDPTMSAKNTSDSKESDHYLRGDRNRLQKRKNAVNIFLRLFFF